MAAVGDRDSGKRSSSMYSYLKELCTCRCCYEIYQDPRSLDCGNTLCKKCIDRVVSQERGACGRCPICGTNIVIAENRLPVNQYIESLIYVLEEANNALLEIRTKENCEQHDVLSIAFCYTCKFSMCESCEKVHRRSTQSNHVVVSLENLIEETNLRNIVSQHKNTLNTCEKHKRLSEFWCLDCSLPVCEFCLLVEHNQHRRENLSVIAERHFKEILDIRLSSDDVLRIHSEARQKYDQELQQVREHNSTVVKELDKWFEDLFKILHQRKEEMLTQFHSEATEQLGNLREQKKPGLREVLITRLNEIRFQIDGVDRFANTTFRAIQSRQILKQWRAVEALQKELQKPVQQWRLDFKPDSSIKTFIEQECFGQFVALSEVVTTEKVHSPYIHTKRSSFDSCVRVTGMCVLDSNTIVVVSHASSKCIGFSKEGVKKWEITEKLKGPFDAVCLLRRVDNPGTIQMYKRSSCGYTHCRVFLDKSIYPRGMCLYNEMLFVCDYMTATVMAFSIGKKFECTLIKKYGVKENLKSPVYVDMTSNLNLVVSDLKRGVRLVSADGTWSTAPAVVKPNGSFTPSQCCCGKDGTVFIGNSIANEMYIVYMAMLEKHQVRYALDKSLGYPLAAAFDPGSGNLWIAHKDGTVVRFAGQENKTTDVETDSTEEQ
ncbi:E3 ubiquitin-protein ligase TRIM7-like isoform X2 [Ostrea edulis]|uniref:E3 ubiquitin-protein ligase TRIM7-like isoform X2 n=1 Tax=Ostrea edulis TaxID=37623 RepID=UPI0024AEFD86|nr:E3 ubiquitin-protein ligase TRIM7-like isoform X2 [Ostrea edulis]